MKIDDGCYAILLMDPASFSKRRNLSTWSSVSHDLTDLIPPYLPRYASLLLDDIIEDLIL